MDHPFHQFIHLRVGYGGPYMTNAGTRQVLPNPPATEITFGTHDDGIHGLAERKKFLPRPDLSRVELE